MSGFTAVHGLLFLYILLSGAEYLLQWLNLRHLKTHGHEVPPGFDGAIDSLMLGKASDYAVDLSRFGLVESLCDKLLLVLFLFGGWLSLYDRWLVTLGGSPVTTGVLFFLGLTLMQTLIGIPFNLYATFRIENRHGFNTTTFGLWCGDLLKSTLIAAILVPLVVSGAFFLVGSSPQHWWLWVWAFIALVGLFLMYLSPYVIEPLFCKFGPVKDVGLEGEIRSLMAKAGLQAGKVLQVDASRRSRHSNAYFTGIGKVKRIVLFDTLLTQMDHREILAVLAHEIGHWEKGHILKRLVLTQLVAFVSCYLSYRLISWGGLPHLVGLQEASFAGQLVILGFLAALPGFLATPVGSWLSRKHELQADDYAAALTGAPEALASSFIKLSANNLSNLHPHPLYAGFYYSHPPVVERVHRLLAAGEK